MQTRNATKETSFAPLSGYAMFVFVLAGLAATIWSFTQTKQEGLPGPHVGFLLGGLAGVIVTIVLLCGFFIVEPNLGRALILFGRYRGTVRESGFYWTNPFTVKRKISLRAHNLNGKTLKVNDLLGNPIEIASIAVWQVRDSAQALFDVAEFEHFVEVQSEAAVRAVASRHPYDDGQTIETATTLRGSADIVALELQHELQQRLEIAGVEVLEARLSHLAYAQEIAAAMLQRQQAGAVIAARKLIVDGAVGMVEMALEKLAHNGVVQLDDERKAAMTGNLLVVLCGQTTPQPVVNTGSLYT